MARQTDTGRQAPPGPAPRRLRRATLAALSAGVLFAAGCGDTGDGAARGTPGTAEAEVLLQPVAVAGPAPFTGSTARPAPAPSVTAKSTARAPGDVRRTRAVSGAAPGLYGGTRSAAACDVEQQIRFLTADRAKGRAFAGVAGIEPVQIPGYLRSLTPVVLRADVQVTSHGYEAGAATSFQSVLQAGTAVMADSRGLPRVRCACGNPLDPPVVAKGGVAHRGERWAGYDPSRVTVVRPSAQVITHLVIVDVADNTWIERPMGDGGGRDKVPDVPPPFEPGDDILPPSRPADPSGSADPTPSGGTGRTDCPAARPGGDADAAAPTGCPTPTGGDGDPDRGPVTPGMPTDDPTGLPPDGPGEPDPGHPADPVHPDGDPDGPPPVLPDAPAEPAAPEPFAG
ncbi:DUF6777 domain-containing protein [Streptomyces sp. NPDC001787]|uniref:DUF6777 domain-containing protein n=1 Tax=Streptomyces sp. NPDC001787 TaxID=3154523 RepID=UPI003321C9F4